MNLYWWEKLYYGAQCATENLMIRTNGKRAPWLVFGGLNWAIIKLWGRLFFGFMDCCLVCGG